MALKHQVGVFDCRWCTMLSLCSGLGPAAMGGTMMPCNEICLQLSQCQQQDPAGSCTTERIQLPQKPPWHICPYFFIWINFPERTIPACNAPTKERAGSPAQQEWQEQERFGPGYLAQQNAEGLRNSSLLTRSVSSVTFSRQAQEPCPSVLCQLLERCQEGSEGVVFGAAAQGMSLRELCCCSLLTVTLFHQVCTCNSGVLEGTAAPANRQAAWQQPGGWSGEKRGENAQWGVQ